MKSLSVAAFAVILTVRVAAAQTTIQLPDSLYTPGDTVTWVKRLAYYCEGPAWNPATGEVTFSQIGSSGPSSNRPDWPIWKIKPGLDTGSIFYNKGQSNGQAIDPQGRLVVIQRATAIRFTAPGVIDTLARSGSNGVVFDAGNNSDGGAGNDIAFASNGAFYFTNLADGIFYVNPAGQLSQAFSGGQSTNGIEWLEEENKVYVHEGSNIQRYDIQANGTLTNRTPFITQSGMGSDGGCIDSHGNRWVGDYSNGILRVFNAVAQPIGTISLRGVSGAYNARPGNAGNANNCTFGGSDLKTLYITGDGGLYSLPVKISGRPSPKAAAVRLGRPASSTKKHPSLWDAPNSRDLRGRFVLKMNTPHQTFLF